MAPGWVLLNRCVVDYIFDDDDEPSWSVAAATEFISRRWGAKAASSIAPHNHPMLATLLSLMPPAADGAVAVLPDPPEIATFMLRVSKSHRSSLPSSRPFVACAGKGLLVLYAGNYFGPGSSMCGIGCYLIHDATAADVLSTVPPPPDTRDLTEGLASGAIVLRCHPASGPSSSSSAYLLVELATMPRRRFPDPDAALLLWRSDEQQWARKEVHLPHEVCWVPGGNDKHRFNADISFAGPGGTLCWVDLLYGIVVCTNPLRDQDPPAVLRFVPLPDGCPAFGWSDYLHRPRMEEHRSAAFVNGRIKVVAMVGELERWKNAQQYRLTTWTLLSPSSSSPDPDHDDDDLSLTGGDDGWQWQEDGVFRLGDLWATEEYRALDLPPQTPVCPVLSAARDESFTPSLTT